MKQINLSELTFSDIFDDLPSIPQNSWVRYIPENKEFLSELKQTNRPWLVSETYFDEPSPSALAYARTRNPKGRKENYFEHKKYPNNSKKISQYSTQHYDANRCTFLLPIIEKNGFCH